MILCKLTLVLSVVSSVSSFAPQALQRSTPSKVSLLPATLEGAEEQFERRSFLAKSVGMTLALSSLIGVPSASLAASASADYKAVAADISELVKAAPDQGPTLVRLAWHSSGTYDKMSKDGGSGKGTIRFKEELVHGGNAGLGKTAVAWLEPLKEKYGENLSYADLYTLGGGMCVCMIMFYLLPSHNTFSNLQFFSLVFIYISCCNQNIGGADYSMVFWKS